MENTYIEYPIGSRVSYFRNDSILGTIVEATRVITEKKYPQFSPEILNRIITEKIKKIVLVDIELWSEDWAKNHKPYFYCGYNGKIEVFWKIKLAINNKLCPQSFCPKCGSNKTNYIALAMKCEDCWFTW